LSVKETEWAIKKIEVLGSMRKREIGLQTIVEEERDLREIEREIEEIRERVPTHARQMFEAFQHARYFPQTLATINHPLRLMRHRIRNSTAFGRRGRACVNIEHAVAQGIRVPAFDRG
jgi:hypothetical protein